jgi:hypothetical protein
MTVYAKWGSTAPIKYTITFDANGGRVSPASIQVEKDKTIASLPIPVKTTGDTYFEGWYSDNGTWQIPFNTTTIIIADTTVYAKWGSTAPIKYTITFDADGGSVIPASMDVIAGETTGTLPVPVKTNYTFGEWWTARNGGGTRFTATTPVTASITVYAKWTVSGQDDNDTSVWIWSNQKYYTVTGGVAVDVYYEMGPAWISYADENHWEQQYNYTIPYNTYTEYDNYYYSVTGYVQNSASNFRNGNRLEIVSHQISEYTTTIDYTDPSIQDSVTTTSSDFTTTSIVIYDEESGLTRSTHLTLTGTQNGSPYNQNSEIDYTLELLNTAGDVKTYKVYDTTTGGTDAYTVYKVKNKITLEIKAYTTEDVLSSTTYYTFPDNAVIKAKLPTLTLYSYTYESTPENNNYQTCEVVSDSATELKIRVKTYSMAGELTAQVETTYIKHDQ